MIRFRDTRFYDALSFHFKCKGRLEHYRVFTNNLLDEAKDLRKEIAEVKKESIKLLAQLEDQKVIYNVMDEKHVADIKKLKDELKEINKDISIAPRPDVVISFENANEIVESPALPFDSAYEIKTAANTIYQSSKKKRKGKK